jgi:DegV family protein with EDD domain
VKRTTLKMTFKKIRFVTDSTCDIPPELVRKFGIGVVPCFVNYGGRSYADDGTELDRQTYYDLLPTMTTPPTTSAPSPGLAERVIRETFEGADHLVMICVPAALSAVYNVLRLGASDLPPDSVTLIDSGTTTIAQGFQVLAGVEVAEQTGDLSEVLSAIERARNHERLYAVPESMEYLRRSGRVGWATAGAANLLQIKPIIQLADGKVDSFARVRTFARAVDKIIELVEEQAPLDRLALLHANNPDGALEMKNRLGSIAPAQTYILNVTPVLGTHIGPKALGVTTLSKAWRQ